MDIGDWDDVVVLIECLGEEHLRKVLMRAEAGQFRPKSWHFWHYKLGFAVHKLNFYERCIGRQIFKIT
jgi:hypothetical protein